MFGLSLVSLGVGVLVGGVLVTVSNVVRGWFTKQVNDAKTHLPGAQ